MRQLQLRFAPTYADYISVIGARFSRVLSASQDKHGAVLPHWAGILLKPLALAWASYGFFTKKRKIGELTLTIDAGGIRLVTRRSDSHVAWSGILDVEQHETGYILLGLDGYGTLIPKRVMSEREHAALGAMIAAWRAARAGSDLRAPQDPSAGQGAR